MNKTQRLAATEKLLRERGVDAAFAKEMARDAVRGGEPILESLCFQRLTEHILASIHTTQWVSNRAKTPDFDTEGVIKRLLDSGASPKDLALFARIMQREYLSNLGCILDATIADTPDLPCQEFRLLAVDDADKPIALLDELHELLGWTDLKTEMRLSREAASQR